MPERIQLSRAKGWRMPENTVKVSRPGRWGNPFYVSKWRDAATCVALFRNAMRGIWNPATSAHLPQAWNGYDDHHRWLFKMGNHPMDMVGELRGKNLACWCKLGEPCHADVLLEMANPDLRQVAQRPIAHEATTVNPASEVARPGEQEVDVSVLQGRNTR